MSTKWTNPTRVKKTYISPQSGRTPRGIKIHVHKVDRPNYGKKKNLHKSTKWTDPTRDQDSCPQSGGIQLRSNNLHRYPKWTNATMDQIRVHKMDGPLEGLRFMSTKWTDPIRVRNFSPQNGRAPRGYTIRPIHKVDRHMFQQMH